MAKEINTFFAITRGDGSYFPYVMHGTITTLHSTNDLKAAFHNALDAEFNNDDTDKQALSVRELIYDHDASGAVIGNHMEGQSYSLFNNGAISPAVDNFLYDLTYPQILGALKYAAVSEIDLAVHGL